MQQPLLDFQHVDIAYGHNTVTHDVSFSVQEGQVVGLVGESGSGKSTLIKAAMGLLGEGGAVPRGSILYKGNSVLGMSESEQMKLRGPELGMIFQDSLASFCPIRTVGAQAHEAISAHSKVSRAESDEMMRETLKRIDISDPDRVLKSYPHELSGGMGQRVGIALALTMNPDVLLADEPTSALDVTTQAQVIKEFRKVNEEYGCAIVMVTHNIGVVRALCDYLVVLKNGYVVEQGSMEQVVEDPQHEYTKKLMAAVPRLARKGY